MKALLKDNLVSTNDNYKKRCTPNYLKIMMFHSQFSIEKGSKAVCLVLKNKIESTHFYHFYSVLYNKRNYKPDNIELRRRTISMKTVGKQTKKMERRWWLGYIL